MVTNPSTGCESSSSFCSSFASTSTFIAYFLQRNGIKLYSLTIFNLFNMEKQIINTQEAPPPIGPYNQAILAGDTLYISGQVCLDPRTGELRNKDIQEETNQVMQNLKAILEHAGLSF